MAHSRPEADAPLVVVHLHGDLGAGKTTLVQGFVRACGITAAVRSPTYTLAQLYELERQTLVHVDLYRLRSAEELEHLGLSEWAAPGFVWLIEWPERAAEILPPADVRVHLRVAAHSHEADVTAGTAAGHAWLARLERLRQTHGS